MERIAKSRRRMMTLIALPIVALVMCASGYLLFVQDRTASVKATLATHKAEVQQQMNTFGETYKKTAQKDRAALIQQQASALKTTDCGPSNLLYPPLIEEMKRCSGYNTALTSLQNDLTTIATALQYDEKVKAVVASALKVDKDPLASLKAEQVAWQAATDNLKKITPPSALKDAQDRLAKQMSSLAKAWGTLQTAHQAKKLKDFKAAKKELASQYEDLRKVAESYDGVYTNLPIDAYASYKQAIH